MDFGGLPFSLIACLLGLLLCGASPKPLEVAYTIREDTLLVTFDLTSLLSAEFLERVDSGLTASLEIHTKVVPVSLDDSPAAQGLSFIRLRCEIRYDLWREEYLVSISDDEADRSIAVSDKNAAISACARPDWLALIELDDLDLRRRYIVEVVLDTRPDRPRTRSRTREHLESPGRGGATRSGGRSLFGTVARALFREHEDHPSPMVVLRGVPFGEPLISQALSAAQGLEHDPAPHTGEGEREEE